MIRESLIGEDDLMSGSDRQYRFVPVCDMI